MGGGEEELAIVVPFFLLQGETVADRSRSVMISVKTIHVVVGGCIVDMPLVLFL